MNQPGYVSSDYLRAAAERAQAFKQRTHDLLALQPGGRVLDVGCGPGVDTCVLAGRVGEAGQVWGVDVDATMVAEARAQAEAQGLACRVTHEEADARSLPFAGGFFDAVRAERLLQVLPSSIDPLAVVQELWRVLKSGGVLLLADADWGTASVECNNAGLERRLMAFFAMAMRPNGFAGRQMPRLLEQVSGTGAAIEIHPMVHRDLALLPFGGGLVDKATAAGVITAEEGRWWLDFLQQRMAAGDLYASVNMVITTVRKTPGLNNE